MPFPVPFEGSRWSSRIRQSENFPMFWNLLATFLVNSRGPSCSGSSAARGNELSRWMLQSLSSVAEQGAALLPHLGSGEISTTLKALNVWRDLSLMKPWQ